MFYALSDSFTGDLPNEYTHGFANTKEVIAFRSRKGRDEWLETTNLATAKPLTRAEALKLIPTIRDRYNYPVKEVRVFGEDLTKIILFVKTSY